MFQNRLHISTVDHAYTHISESYAVWFSLEEILVFAITIDVIQMENELLIYGDFCKAERRKFISCYSHVGCNLTKQIDTSVY